VTRLERVTATPEALALLDDLAAEHGPLVFHQSGGCCDGSSPMCFPRGEFRIGSRDVDLGTVGDVPFFISGPQYAYWSHTHLTVDVVKGRGSGFSVEAPRGVRFMIRSRLYDEAEQALLEAEGTPPTGPREERVEA
jgi:uncharacterized protein (DUF779 family)